MIFLLKQGYRASYHVDQFLVRDAKCLGCSCFKPGERVIIPKRTVWRQFTGKPLMICTTMYDDDCPGETDYSKEIFMQKIQDGWRSRVV